MKVNFDAPRTLVKTFDDNRPAEFTTRAEFMRYLMRKHNAEVSEAMRKTEEA